MKQLLFFLFLLFLWFNSFAQVEGPPPNCGLGYFLEGCDINNSGYSQFDLYNANEYIFCPIGESNYETPKFYLTEADANAEINYIQDPKNYMSISNPQTIYAKAKYKGAGTVTDILKPFDLETKELIYSATRLYNCGDDSGYAIFDLTTAITFCDSNNQEGYLITYYISQEDANNRLNPINNPNNYFSETTTIFMVLENSETGWFQHNSFKIVVNSKPYDNENEFDLCDDDDDGIQTFDFNRITFGIVNEENGYTLSYFTSFSDAENNIGEIPSVYRNKTNPETVYLKISSPEGCFSISPIELIVYELPSKNIITDLISCDYNDDGIATFDLTLKEEELKGGQIYNTINGYFATFEDADSYRNKIEFPNAYENVGDSEKIYALVNGFSGCQIINEFNSYGLFWIRSYEYKRIL